MRATARAICVGGIEQRSTVGRGVGGQREPAEEHVGLDGSSGGVGGERHDLALVLEGAYRSSLVTCSKKIPREALPGIERSGVSVALDSDHDHTEPDCAVADAVESDDVGVAGRRSANRRRRRRGRRGDRREKHREAGTFSAEAKERRAQLRKKSLVGS